MPEHTQFFPSIDLKGTGSCASFNLRRTARAVTRLFDLAFQKSGIRSTQFAILIGIAKTQPVSISALGDLLVIDRTTLTRSLRLLQKEGLLSISARSQKRQRFLALTEKGAQSLAVATAEWHEIQERFVAAVGADNWSQLRKKLEDLAGIALRLEADHE